MHLVRTITLLLCLGYITHCEGLNRVKVVCEKNRATIRCPGNTAIQVVDAFYGRRDRQTCPHSSIKTTNCYCNSSKTKVNTFCNRKQACTLTASNSVYGDPCVGTYKYLRVVYRCVKGKAPAFSVAFRVNKFMNLAKGQVLKFDRVLLNRGNGYNPRTGYFTVPWSGIYQVACTVRSIRSKTLHVYLYVNNRALFLAYGRNWTTGSLQTVLYLRKGERLHIRSTRGSYAKNEAIQGGAASMFSAVYLSD